MAISTTRAVVKGIVLGVCPFIAMWLWAEVVLVVNTVAPDDPWLRVLTKPYLGPLAGWVTLVLSCLVSYKGKVPTGEPRNHWLNAPFLLLPVLGIAIYALDIRQYFVAEALRSFEKTDLGGPVTWTLLYLVISNGYVGAYLGSTFRMLKSSPETGDVSGSGKGALQEEWTMVPGTHPYAVISYLLHREAGVALFFLYMVLFRMLLRRFEGSGKEVVSIVAFGPLILAIALRDFLRKRQGLSPPFISRKWAGRLRYLSYLIAAVAAIVLVAF